MFIYRITQKKYAHPDGMGGLLVSGRWHKKGYRIAYFSESRALAILEFLVHIKDFETVPADTVLLTLKIPDSSIRQINQNNLPESWRENHKITQMAGTQFLEDQK